MPPDRGRSCRRGRRDRYALSRRDPRRQVRSGEIAQLALEIVRRHGRLSLPQGFSRRSVVGDASAAIARSGDLLLDGAVTTRAGRR
jgi:hypothetical protein